MQNLRKETPSKKKGRTSIWRGKRRSSISQVNLHPHRARFDCRGRGKKTGSEEAQKDRMQPEKNAGGREKNEKGGIQDFTRQTTQFQEIEYSSGKGEATNEA